jgi:hypothetical protein
MTEVFVLLTWWSLKNRIRMRLRRLREPRYLVGGLFAIAYFGWLFARPRARSRGQAFSFVELIDRFHDPLLVGASVVLFGLVAISWVLSPSASRILVFSPSEVQHLFPAPITRRQLIHYRILRSQIAMLFTSALVTVVFRPGSLAENGLFFTGFTLASITLNVHLMGVGLARASLSRHGLVGLRRQWLPLAIVVGVAVVLAFTGAYAWATAGSSAVPTSTLIRAWNSTAVSAVLFPFRAVAALPLARSFSELALALPAASIVLALSYRWVLQSDVAFEEAAALAAERTLERREAQPAGPPAHRRLAPYTLSPSGPPEQALLWKNLISVSRYASGRTLRRVMPPVLVLGTLLGWLFGEMAPRLAVTAMAAAGVAVLFGPQGVRHDLRQDLSQLAVLKTWPVRGAALVRGEVLAPIVVLTGIVWALLALAVAFNPELITMRRPGFAAASALLVAAMLAPGVIGLQVIAQNVIAILWPAWVSADAVRARGIEAMGQRLVMTVLMGLVLIAGLVAPALVAGGVIAVTYALTSTVPIILPAGAAAVVLVVECYAATAVAGRLLDATDLSHV